MVAGSSCAAYIDIWQTGRYVAEKTDVLLIQTWQALICFIASSMCTHSSSSPSTLKQDIPLKSQSVHKQLSADSYGHRKGCCDEQVLWITKVFEKLYHNVLSAKHTILSCTDFRPCQLLSTFFSFFIVQLVYLYSQTPCASLQTYIKSAIYTSKSCESTDR